jgi:hypothetical protein
MADFRKWILVLAVLAVVAAPASAQLACTARATPTQIRSAGITELVGDTFLTCANDVTRVVSVEAIIGLTNITSERTASGASTVKAFLQVIPFGGALGDEQQAPVTYTGILQTDNSIVWESVSVPAVVAPATRVLIRITNIRVNASALGVGVGGAVTQVPETVLVSGTDVLDVPNNVLNVGAVRNGIVFSVDDSPATFQSCLGHNTGITASSPSGTADFQLLFEEGFASAFKTIEQERNPLDPDGDATPVAIGGDVSNATRLRAVFANVPTGVSVWVEVNAGGVLTGDFETSIVSGADDTVALGYRRVTLTGGTGSVVWEITGNNNADPLALLEEATFNVIVSFPANVNVPVQLGPTPAATVGGSFAPISTVTTASNNAPIPRFIDTAVAEDLFQVRACVTNLLFPYVTNQGGFDTGIALVNTSLDNSTGASGTPPNQPFNTTSQSGACTVYYFGAMGNGASLPAPQTTANIPAGQMVTFALSTGGVSGATQSAVSFQGYLIARCNFQFAHGLAFITDVGVNRVAHGYLALVIPDLGSGGRLPNPFPEAGAGSGEQLGY